jgi:hypothetical protein
MSAKFSVHYIRSTQKEIVKTRAKGNAKIADGKALLEQADALEKILGDQSVSADVVVENHVNESPKPVFQEE